MYVVLIVRSNDAGGPALLLWSPTDITIMYLPLSNKRSFPKVFGENSAICAARAFATTLGQGSVRRDLVFRVYAVENPISPT